MAQSFLTASHTRVVSGRTVHACKSRRVLTCLPRHRQFAVYARATVAFLEADVQSLQLAKQRIQAMQADIGAMVKQAAAEAPARRIQRDRASLAAYIKEAAKKAGAPTASA